MLRTEAQAYKDRHWLLDNLSEDFPRLLCLGDMNGS